MHARVLARVRAQMHEHINNKINLSNKNSVSNKKIIIINETSIIKILLPQGSCKIPKRRYVTILS